MLLGEFLIQKGAIDVSSYIKAKLVQAERLSSLPQAIYTLRLLNDSQMLDVFNHQTRRHLDFKDSCKELNLWSEDFESALLRYFFNDLIPIGEILVELGYITDDQLQNLMEEYTEFSET